MKTKPLSLLVVCCGVFAAVAAGLKDGVYVGSAGGHHGPVKVVVTVASGKIDEIDVATFNEKRGRKELSNLCRRIEQANSTDVDAISGATVTSDDVKAAVKDALKKAR